MISRAKAHLTALAACAVLVFVSAQATAQATQDRAVEQYLCKDVMRESGTNRDVAVAFLHGFLLGKSGGSTFNLDQLRKQSDAFVEACLEKPTDKAVDVMSAVRR